MIPTQCRRSAKPLSASGLPKRLYFAGLARPWQWSCGMDLASCAVSLLAGDGVASRLPLQLEHCAVSGSLADCAMQSLGNQAGVVLFCGLSAILISWCGLELARFLQLMILK